MSLVFISQSKLYSWLLASRPKTLVAAFVPVLVGSVLAFTFLKNSNKSFELVYSLLALFCSIFIQIGTNLVNDALDFKKGIDSHTRIGPKRATQSGLLSYNQVFGCGLLCFFVALILGIPLVLHGGLPILILGFFSLLCGYLYTGGPFPLAYIGLGEFFVIIFFGFAAVCGVFYLQTGFINTKVLIASLQLGCLATVLIAINNFRDAIEDKKGNKMTLAARFGNKFARMEILFLFFLSYALGLYWILNQFFWAGLLPLLSLPVAVKVCKGILYNEPSLIFNKYLGMSALVQVLFGLFLSLGFIL